MFMFKTKQNINEKGKILPCAIDFIVLRLQSCLLNLHFFVHLVDMERRRGRERESQLFHQNLYHPGVIALILYLTHFNFSSKYTVK